MPDNYTGPFGCFYRDGDEDANTADATPREELNQTKRSEMHKICVSLIELGWTVAHLAAYCGINPVVVRSWKNGKSMGNNEQRSQLSDLLDKDAIVKLDRRIAELCVIVDEEANKARAAGLKEDVLRYASDRMVRAQKWRDALMDRRDVLVMG